MNTVQSAFTQPLPRLQALPRRPQLPAPARPGGATADRVQLTGVGPMENPEGAKLQFNLSQVARATVGRVAHSLVPAPLATVAAAVEPPPSTPIEMVTTDYHGTTVQDPYRWLENSGDLAALDWVTAQNAYTEKTLAALPGKAPVVDRLQQVLSVGSISAPDPIEGKAFYFRRDGLQNQAVLYLQQADGSERPVIDPNTWSQDGTEALDWNFPSTHGNFVAYGRSSGGTENSTLHVVDVNSQNELPDQIPNARAASLAWLPDESGFYYTRYPKPGTVPQGQENYNRRVFFHSLGSDSEKDPMIFGEGLNQTDWPDLNISPDGRHLFINVGKGDSSTDAYVLDRQSNKLITLAEGENATFGGMVVDGQAYVITSLEAPRNRIMKVDLEHPERDHWKELVPQQEGALQTFAMVGGKLITSQLINASTQLTRYDLDGNKEHDIPLPAIGSADSLGGEIKGKDLYFRFNSFNVPPTVFRYNVDTGESKVWRKVEVPGFKPEDYDVHQEWYASKDGTKVPMFLVHKKGLELDGSHPTYLTAYGGFDISLTPGFSSTAVPWLEAGGVFAQPNLRGGGEFGEAWHQAGMLGNKQNVFDDFEAAGQWLIDNKYTSTQKLGITGGSNGGLLMGAALTQKPELYGAVVSHVPLLDMVRYHHFGIARLWISEYGSADDAQQFQWLNAYSPYHNVHDGTAYPPVMFMSGAGDGRVDPLHARKMAARVQAANGSDNPVLLREEAKAGHGQGKPIGKVIEEKADELAFMGSHLGLDFSAPSPASPAQSAAPGNEAQVGR